MRIAFAGTPEFAVTPLAALLDSDHEIVGVLTQPDRPAGRGRELKASAVKEFALSKGLIVAQPSTLRTPEGRAVLESWKPDVLVVVAYGLILPREVLAIPRLGCINIHASLLPRWRGAAPVQRAILAGDAETGVTVMLMNEGLDTGPILRQQALTVTSNDDTTSVLAAIASIGAPALLVVLEELDAGRLVPQPQPGTGVTYAKKIDKTEARIDWRESADAIYRKIRAFRPWPIAATSYRGEQLRILRARVLEHAEPSSGAIRRDPGSLHGLYENMLVVACGKGLLGVLEVQRAGRRSMTAREFVNGLSAADEAFI